MSLEVGLDARSRPRVGDSPSASRQRLQAPLRSMDPPPGPRLPHPRHREAATQRCRLAAAACPSGSEVGRGARVHDSRRSLHPACAGSVAADAPAHRRRQRQQRVENRACRRPSGLRCARRATAPAARQTVIASRQHHRDHHPARTPDRRSACTSAPQYRQRRGPRAAAAPARRHARDAFDEGRERGGMPLRHDLERLVEMPRPLTCHRSCVR